MKSYPSVTWLTFKNELCVVSPRQLTSKDGIKIKVPCFGGGECEKTIIRVEAVSGNGKKSVVEIGEYEHRDSRGHIYSVNYL